MRIQHFLTHFTWIYFLLIALLLPDCKKADTSPGIKSANTVAESQPGRFFSDHLPAEPLARAIREFVIREDQLYHFSGEYLKKIGVPRWDKTISYTSAKNAVNSSYDSTISYIPFIKDQQTRVNAALVVKTVDSDTSFRILYRGEYDDFGFDETTGGKQKARNIFHLFASMENAVFGTKKFVVTDERLLTDMERAEIAAANLNWNDITVTYTLDKQAGGLNANRALAVENCVVVSYCIEYGLKAFKPGLQTQPVSVNNGDAPCIAWETYTECWTVWIDIPDVGIGTGTGSGTGGSGGGGGGGGGGSNWPSPMNPSPCESGRVASSCEDDGWVSLPAYQVLAFENMLAPGDGFEYNVLTNASFQVFSSVYEFQLYKDAVGDPGNTSYDLSIPAIVVSQQEKTKRGRFNLNFIGGIDVEVTLEKLNEVWGIKEVKSDTWGFTPMTSWHQGAISKTLTGNEIILEVRGKLHYNIVINNIGTIYKQDFKFRLKFNNITGDLISISRF